MLDRIRISRLIWKAQTVKAKSLFDTLNLPQNPTACGFWTRTDMKCSFGRPGQMIARLRTFYCVFSAYMNLSIRNDIPNNATMNGSNPALSLPRSDLT
jgi:hypothetical protein